MPSYFYQIKVAFSRFWIFSIIGLICFIGFCWPKIGHCVTLEYNLPVEKEVVFLMMTFSVIDRVYSHSTQHILCFNRNEDDEVRLRTFFKFPVFLGGSEAVPASSTTIMFDQKFLRPFFPFPSGAVEIGDKWEENGKIVHSKTNFKSDVFVFDSIDSNDGCMINLSSLSTDETIFSGNVPIKRKMIFNTALGLPIYSYSFFSRNQKVATKENHWKSFVFFSVISFLGIL